MSESTDNLRRKIDGARDLQSVVRTMKAVAASSLGQYEKATRALDDYHRAVKLGLGACIRSLAPLAASPRQKAVAGSESVGAIVFGSDQGLVGRFNEAIVEFAIRKLSEEKGDPMVWAVGERVHARLSDAGIAPAATFPVPTSVGSISPLVGRIQIASESNRAKGEYARLYIFHNRPLSGALYEPTCQRLLPLDENWQIEMGRVGWPTRNPPEILGDTAANMRAFVREYLFISLYRACAESLASENAARLSAMRRADKNIDDLLEDLDGLFNRLRQNGIDEELFDVVAGSEALADSRHPAEIA